MEITWAMKRRKLFGVETIDDYVCACGENVKYEYYVNQLPLTGRIGKVPIRVCASCLEIEKKEIGDPGDIVEIVSPFGKMTPQEIRKSVLSVIKQNGGESSVREIENNIFAPTGAIEKAIAELLKASKINRIGRGRYSISDVQANNNQNARDSMV